MKKIMVIGAGGIGSFLIPLLNRVKEYEITVWDNDIVEEKNLSKITQQINFSLGVEKGYLPESEDIIFISAMVGGGDTTDSEMDMSKLDKTKSYIFFCSFPGHWALMRGKIKII